MFTPFVVFLPLQGFDPVKVVLTMLENNKFISKINDLTRKGKPFLFIIDYAGQSPLIYPLDKLPHNIRFSTPGFPDRISSTKMPDLKLKKHPVSYHSYLEKFNFAMAGILHGNTYLLNLTQPTNIELNWSLEMIYRYSKAPYKLLIKDKFVVFSPERFISIKGNRIETFPMKGTIDATVDNAEAVLLHDIKETAEHNTIVDLMRNDLSRFAHHVTVEKFRYIDHIKTHEKEILQVSSEISGIISDDYIQNPGEMITSLLPAGSISGAPKEKTVEMLSLIEGYERGYYTGIFGVFDGENFDTAVMIRFIEQSSSGYIYKSGGGITHLSEPTKEYQELIDKVYVPVT